MVRLFVAVLACGLSATAAAQPGDSAAPNDAAPNDAAPNEAAPPKESARLFEEGRALAKQGKYEQACATFSRSLELERAPGTLLNLADCHEHLGHLAQAYRLFQEAERVSVEEHNDDSAKYARERAKALVPRTSTVVVHLATPALPGMSVSIAGRAETPASEIREIVDPGEITVEVQATGRQTFVTTEHAEPATRIVVDVPELPLVQRETVVQTRRRRTRVVTAYTLAGIGAAGVVASVVMGFTAKSRYDAEFDNANCSSGDPPRCNPEGYANQNSAITLATIGTVVGAGGLALIAGGAVVYLTAPRDIVVIPTASAEAGGLAVMGRF
jgi:hypothetical protein